MYSCDDGEMQMKTIAQLRPLIKTKIFEAFGINPYPGDEYLAVDQSGYDLECREIVSDFKGKNWKDVSVEMLHKHKEALPLFTPTAFRYYLPAYMIGCADSYYGVDVALDSVLFNLTPPKPRRGREWDFFWARAQQFNEVEREAIRLFLELMEQYELNDWLSEGMERPENRVKPALDFWTELNVSQETGKAQ
jgi:hypothetical protein